MNIEIMIDGHGFFSLPAAIRIAQALRDIQPMWLEDVIKPDNADTIAEFRDKAGVPIAVSEMLVSRDDYRQILTQRGADYIMTDPTWVGGISETRRTAEFAQVFNVPTLMHDCTGPLTLFSGLHVDGGRAERLLSGNRAGPHRHAVSASHRRTAESRQGAHRLALTARPRRAVVAGTVCGGPSGVSDQPVIGLSVLQFL